MGRDRTSPTAAVPVRRPASRLSQRPPRPSLREHRHRRSGARSTAGLSAPCTGTAPLPAGMRLGSRPHRSSSLARPAPRSATSASSRSGFCLRPPRLSR
jgi:hypothetical protein